MDWRTGIETGRQLVTYEHACLLPRGLRVGRLIAFASITHRFHVAGVKLRCYVYPIGLIQHRYHLDDVTRA